MAPLGIGAGGAASACPSGACFAVLRSSPDGSSIERSYPPQYHLAISFGSNSTFTPDSSPLQKWKIGTVSESCWPTFQR